MENNFKIAVPEGCRAEIKQEDGFLVVTFEPEKWEPKNGDIVAFGMRPSDPSIGIFKSDDGDTFRSYATVTDGIISFFESGWVKDNIRPATEEEKQRLFDALAKEGKRWNAEEKRIEDLPRRRAEKGDTYYYVNSELNVDDDAEEHWENPDTARYRAGNYFLTREAAEKVAAKIREIFKESDAG